MKNINLLQNAKTNSTSCSSTTEKSGEVSMEDKRSSSCKIAQYKKIMNSANDANTLQLKFGGSYEETDKSDAHHMPSARALAAIVVANQKKNSLVDVSNDNVRDYHTLGVNNIYKGAPAVWMPHSDHAATRTYGGRSTTALSNDWNIIANNDSDTAIDQIQGKDLNDFDGCTKNTDSISGKKLIGNATSTTKSNVKSAITNMQQVMADKNDSTTMIPIAMLYDDALALYNKYSINELNELFKQMGSDNIITGNTVFNIKNKKVTNVQKNTADAIKDLMAYLG